MAERGNNRNGREERTARYFMTLIFSILFGFAAIQFGLVKPIYTLMDHQSQMISELKAFILSEDKHLRGEMRGKFDRDQDQLKSIRLRVLELEKLAAIDVYIHSQDK